MNGHVFVAITVDDGTVHIMDFITVGRGSVLPRGAKWVREGWWTREPTNENIFAEISRTYPTWSSSGRLVNPTGYKIVALEAIPASRGERNLLLRS
mgnify:FL=1